MIWFTSDWHFYHEMILKYCERPFDTAGKMRSYILGQLKKYVKESDTLYIVGDMSLLHDSNSNRLMEDLKHVPGKKILIWGNHDRMQIASYLDMGISEIHSSLPFEYMIDSQRGYDFYLAHDPAWAQIPNTNWIHGHVHRMWKFKHLDELNVNLINVSVDVWDFKPVSIDQIIALMRTNECHTHEK